MTFSDWLPLLLLLLTAFAIFIAAGRTRRRWIVTTLRVGAVIVFAATAMLGFLCWRFSDFGKVTDEEPVYSPDGSRAFRVRVADAGATGGSNSVLLTPVQGSSEAYVFTGSWESVNRHFTRWLSPTDLLVVYNGRMARCQSTGEVRVICKTAAEAPLPEGWPSPFPRF